MKEVKKALATGRRIEVATGIGQQLVLDPTRTTSLLGIVILDLVYEGASGDRTRIFSPFSVEHGMPVHAFTRQDFEVVAREYDTLPDFLEYVSLRERLYGGGHLFAFTNEEDLIAAHKLNDPSIEEVLVTQNSRLVIEPGYWNRFQSYGQELRSREEANRASYLVDAAISELHHGIGFSPSAEDSSIPPDEDAQGSLEGHLEIATRLGRLSRLERRLVGELLLGKMRTAQSKPFSFGVMLVPDGRGAVVVVSTKAPRGERRRILTNVASAAAVHLRVPEVVGIATEPFETPGRSFDSCLVLTDGISEEARKEFGELGGQLFGPLQERVVTEFPGTAI